MALWSSLRLPWLSFDLIAVTYAWSLSSIHCYCHDDCNSLMAQLDFLPQCAVATENSVELLDLSLPCSPWSQQSSTVSMSESLGKFSASLLVPRVHREKSRHCPLYLKMPQINWDIYFPLLGDYE